MFMAAAGAGVTAGIITGGGPEDPDLRRNLRAQGWQPYSIYNPLTKRYTSYQGLEPPGSIIGIAADATEIAMRAGSIKDAQDVAVVASMAVARQVTNKTFLQGSSELFHAIDDPVRYGDSYFSRLGATVVPNVINQWSKSRDPYMREANGVLQAIKSRTPWRTDLEKKRDRWGEPIVREGSLAVDFLSPLYQSTKKEDAVDDMIAENEIQIPRIRRTINIGGVPIELNDEQFTRYQQLAGVNARTLVEKQSRKAEFTKATDGPEGGKSIVVRQAFQSGRAAARRELVKEFPDLEVLAQLKRREVRALQGRR